VIPRDGLRPHRLPEQVREGTFAVDQATLTAKPWILEPPAVAALMKKRMPRAAPAETQST
jgi:hypothetical protein